ncbi:non-ribosomal peptide synthetase [Pseudoalteromonas luteoviolacea]|uniref:non-ribosomal peptide synthetase n=1 Tax=Pseudoalteromonas luteoviolacea TaxID=43657 RepID=UPI001B35CE97|nr:amino acid adenylation domain-containing protein [Pseudoalteromonas luteoviolacea]
MKEVYSKITELGVSIYLDNGVLKAKAPKGRISPEIAQLIKDNKNQLIDYLTDKTLDKRIKKIARSEVAEQLHPMSFAQQGLWLIDKLHGGSSQYNMSVSYEVTPSLDIAVMKQVFNIIVSRHEVLRTVYIEYEGEVKQSIRPASAVEFELTCEDLSQYSEEKQRQLIRLLAAQEQQKAFNLSEDLMLRARYFKTDLTYAVLTLSMHHIASDGWSIDVLAKEFFTLYQALIEGKKTSIPALEIQYVDYAYWQRESLSNKRLDKQIGYWTQQLQDLPVVHNLPLCHPRPSVKQYVGGITQDRLPAPISNNLHTLAKQNGMTPFMLLHGALSLLFSRHSNSADIVIGTPVANRAQKELASLIGFFVNTLVLRVDTDQESLASYFEHIKQVHQQAQANQDVPLEQLAESLNISRSTSHSPLFQIAMTVNNGNFGNGVEGLNESLAGVTIRRCQVDSVLAKFDLSVELNINEQGLEINWVYDTSLFSEQAVKRFSKHFCRLLTELSHISNLRISPHDVPMLDEQETHYLVTELNATQQEYPHAPFIHEFIEQQAQIRPNSVALIFATKSMTYKELNERANQLAHHLVQKHGVKPNTLVGLCAERSLEMIVGILGILKAGGAYIPLDPSYPRTRLEYMFEDAALTTMVSHRQAHDALTGFSGEVINLDDVQLYSHYSTQNIAKETLGLNAHHLAYVVYTSGSTGKPKGVMISHASLTNTMLHSTTCPPFNGGPDDVFYQATSIAFDAAIWLYWCALASGSKLRLASSMDFQKELELYADVTHLLMTPSILEVVKPDTYQSLKVVATGGESCSLELVKKWRALGVQFYNYYGPTEITIYSSRGNISNGEQIHIGCASANVQYFILDRQQRLLPYGAIGELYIGGKGVAQGYLNLPTLTQQRFISNPFYDQNNPASSERLYRTGDLVRYLDNGKLAFVGREDQQVKIRGFRLELGDVEAQLTAHPDIDSALVTATELGSELQLIGYIKPAHQLDNEEQFDWVKKVKLELLAQLPDHMIPSVLLAVDAWPLTKNGKVDRRALPLPDLGALVQGYVAPTTEAEKKLVAILAELLGIDADKLSTAANFFQLGGNSLMSIRLVSRIRAQFEVELPVQSVFESKTLSSLAAMIEQRINCHLATSSESHTESALSRHIVPVERASSYRILSSAQNRLWFIDKLQGGASQYNISVALEYSSTLDLNLLERVFATIIDRHHVLRTVYREQDKEVHQHVIPMTEVDFKVAVHDLSHQTHHIEGDSNREGIQALINDEVAKPFDLRQAPMLRVSCFEIVKGDSPKGVLVLNMHHIASDGWSAQLLMKEFFSLYRVFLNEEPDPLPALKVQYYDYANWQHNNLNTPAVTQQLAYWKSKLSELPATHRLPLSSARPKVKEYRGKKVASCLDRDTSSRLIRLAKHHQLTPFMLLHGALALVLARHSNDSDVVIGTPVANRLQPDVEALIGCFVNTLVLRVDTDKASLGEYFNYVKTVHMEAQSNQDVPFELLVDELKVPRSTAHSPLFQIMLTINNDFGIHNASLFDSTAAVDIDVQPFQVTSVQTKFDLDIDIQVSDSGISINWVYDVTLFQDAYIRQLSEHLHNLLVGLSRYQGLSNTPLRQLQMLSEQEQQHLVNELNDTAVDFSPSLCIHELFELQVTKTPDAIAVSFEGTDLTFAQLNERANRLAHYLKNTVKVPPSALVGVCTERSLGLVVGMLAIFKTGAAYLPLEPSLPKDRLKHLIDDSESMLILTHTHIQSVLPDYEGQLVLLDEFEQVHMQLQDSVFSACEVENIATSEVQVAPSDLAYVFYTSGSTGQPKGTLNSHSGLVNRLHTLQHQFKMQPNDKILQKTQISFDVSLGEILWPLTSGGTLILAKPGAQSDPDYLTDTIVAQGITIIHFVPSMLQLFINHADTSKLESLRLLMTSGEALNYNLQAQVIDAFENVELVNQYGPTEAAIEVSYWHFNTLRKDKRVPIGYPSANTKLLILDKDGNLAPKGAQGELYIAGCQVGLGYLKQAQLTAQRFVTLNMLGVEHKAYRTGDLARWLSDGSIEFLGRLDGQVKLRGMRIELGEIESKMRDLESVHDAVVLVKERAENQVLCAFVQVANPNEGSPEFINSLRQALQLKLPAYMVPSAISVVDTFPLSANGKVDRLALMAKPVSSHKRVAAKAGVETVILEIWSKELGISINELSIDDNFFEVGGNSLNTISVCKEINHQLNTSLQIADLFQYPSVGQLSQFVSKSNVNKVKRKNLDGAKNRIMLARKKFNKNNSKIKTGTEI